jgi:hypothetical protein
VERCEYSSTFPDLGTRDVSGQHHAPAALAPEKVSLVPMVGVCEVRWAPKPGCKLRIETFHVLTGNRMSGVKPVAIPPDLYG